MLTRKLARPALAAFLSLLMLTVPAAMHAYETALSAAKTEIKVLTYNIFHGERFYQRGAPNLDAVAAVIRAEAPDLVALQEVDRHTQRSAALLGGTPQDLAAELARLTGLHATFGRAMEQHGGDYGNAILSRSPLSLATAQTLILDAPEGGEPRALLTIEHTLPNGQRLTFAATHLCHLSEASRLAQVRQILHTLGERSREGPVILAGDFNFETGESPYDVLAAALQDTGAVFGNTAHTWPTDAPDTRLDIVFVDKHHRWAVKDVRLIQTDASDHLPVVVTLELLGD